MPTTVRYSKQQKVAKRALLTLAMVLAPILVYGQTQSGSLDTSFGTGGTVTTNFGAPAFAGEVAIQPDGKIIVVGKVSLSTTLDDFAVARYNTDGTLDASFGAGGKVTTDFAGGFDLASFVAVQPDGKIVVAGTAGIAPFANFGLARYNGDGTLDLSFGTGGKVTTNFGNVSAQAYSLALQPDGKIVLAGYVNFNGGESFGLARYNTNGTLDVGFGMGGKLHTEFDAVGQTFSFAFAYSVAIQQDGKIVAAGESTINQQRDFALVRYNSNGTLDTGFGPGGKVTTDFFSFADLAGAITIQHDGKIVAAGAAATSTAASSSFNFALARYNSNGTLDPTFGTGGKVATDFAGASDIASAVAIQLDGKIIAAGTATINGFFDGAFGLARYNSDGTLDSSFGTGGKLTTNFGAGSDGASSIALQQDGKIVAAGVAEINGNDQFALARYLNDTSSPIPTPSPTPNTTTGAVIQFSQANYRVNEGGVSVTLTVNRSGDTSGNASVSYVTTDTDNFTVSCSDTTNNHGGAFGRCDYATSVDTLNFAAGETSKTITIPIIDDSIAEGNETFSIVLSNVSGGSLGSASTATVTINDNDAVTGPNPIFTTPFFVRQQYLDFLSREPEVGEPWSAVLNNCSDVNNNPACDRLTVSAAFFGSPEFQLKGYFVYRFYKLGFNRLPTYTEMVTDMRAVSGATSAEVFQKKAKFTNSFVKRTEFTNAYDGLSNSEYVTTLLGRYGLTSITSPDQASPDGSAKVTLTSTDLQNRLTDGTLTRPQVLRAIADSDQVFSLEFNSAFVAMQYFGYLRRAPDTDGFNAWLNFLNQNPNDSRTIVNGLMNSPEYRLRFGP